MTWDDLKLRYARVTAKELTLVEWLLDFIESQRTSKQSGSLEYHADNNGVVVKAKKIELMQV